MKSGTSWWAHLVSAHPNAQRVTPKELHFFDRFGTCDFTDADREEYWKYFARREGVISGEWTPRYMWDFWTPELIRRAAPNARILVMLRDPVERYVSGFIHGVGQRRGTPEKDLVQLHYARGLYDVQIQRLLDHFPRSQILVLQYERCVRSTSEELSRTYEFLGLEPFDFEPPEVQSPIGVTRMAKPVLSDRMRDALRENYEASVSRLLELVPEIDRDLWPNFRSVALSRSR